jgi:hypothetical protein
MKGKNQLSLTLGAILCTASMAFAERESLGWARYGTTACAASVVHFLPVMRSPAVDAFYAPVAFGVQTYGLSLDTVSMTLRDQPHDDEITQAGRVLEDLRAT